MANLRDRLKRIKEQKDSVPARKEESREQDQNPLILLEQGWVSCGFKVIKRDVNLPSPFELIKNLPPSLAVLVNDLAGRKLPDIKDFLFFDLETTGLSGGAGTVAFLAAFGRIVSGSKLRITQYLLLDYPGENDFLENVLSEFKNKESVIVSYNGKCFDSQIIKTRCLMNRMKIPEYWHVDLLHPARRLWKNIIADCSQASVETKIMGIDRSGDIPGSLAPEIWFEFLKTGKTERLIGICDHNKADISGLAKILSAVISIAADPFNMKYRFDLERLALYWRQYIRKISRYQALQTTDEELQATGENLLHLAAEKDYPQAVYVYGFDQMRKRNYARALEYVNRGLRIFEQGLIQHDKLLRRKELLKRKTQN